MRGVDAHILCAYISRMRTNLNPKKAVNLTVDAKLLERVRESNINVSAVLDSALREEIARRWRAENAEAFEENRKRVEAEGLWCDDLRPW
jgi:antitoxin CcdA